MIDENLPAGFAGQHIDDDPVEEKEEPEEMDDDSDNWTLRAKVEIYDENGKVDGYDTYIEPQMSFEMFEMEEGALIRRLTKKYEK